jgi:uncharacterized protein (DUF2147 family)
MLLTIGGETSAFANDPPFFGDWARGDGKAHIRIERCGGDVCAINTWVRSGVSGERIGDVLTLNINPDGRTGWSGSAFDRQRNLNYTMTVRVADNRMTSNGCVIGGLLCKSMSWARL